MEEMEVTALVGKTVAAVERDSEDGSPVVISFTDGTKVMFKGCWTNDNSDWLDVFDVTSHTTEG